MQTTGDYKSDKLFIKLERAGPCEIKDRNDFDPYLHLPKRTRTHLRKEKLSKYYSEKKLKEN